MKFTIGRQRAMVSGASRSTLTGFTEPAVSIAPPSSAVTVLPHRSIGRCLGQCTWALFVADFISVAEWEDEDSRAAWKQTPEFAEKQMVCSALCDDFYGVGLRSNGSDIAARAARWRLSSRRHQRRR